MGFVYVLFAILELAIIVLSHILIPIIFAKKRRTYRDKTLWLIAFANALLGYVICALLAESATLTGVWFSACFAIVGYIILDKNCSNKLKIEINSTDEDIKERLNEKKEQGEISTDYIKRLIREDKERELT